MSTAKVFENVLQRSGSIEFIPLHVCEDDVMMTGKWFKKIKSPWKGVALFNLGPVWLNFQMYLNPKPVANALKPDEGGQRQRAKLAAKAYIFIFRNQKVVSSNMFHLNWSSSYLCCCCSLLDVPPSPASHATPVAKLLLKPPHRLFAEGIFLPNELGCDGGIVIYAPGASAPKMML